jgi:hypothetical protein
MKPYIFTLFFFSIFNSLFASGEISFDYLAFFLTAPLGIISFVIGLLMIAISKGQSRLLNYIKFIIATLTFFFFLLINYLTIKSSFSFDSSKSNGPLVVSFMGILFLFIGYIVLLIQFKSKKTNKNATRDASHP